MAAGEIERRRAAAADKLYAAGAHYVIDTLAQLPAAIADINRRLAKGERP
jgi:phosphonoacetaldehyde hydrolase